MTAYTVCPGSDRVPRTTFRSMTGNRVIDARCPVCDAWVTCSPNAAGVVRINEHDQVVDGAYVTEVQS